MMMADDDARGAGDERRAKMISHRKRQQSEKKCEGEERKKNWKWRSRVGPGGRIKFRGDLPKEEAVGGRELSRFVVFLVFLVFLVTL